MHWMDCFSGVKSGLSRESFNSVRRQRERYGVKLVGKEWSTTWVMNEVMVEIPSSTAFCAGTPLSVKTRQRRRRAPDSVSWEVKRVRKAEAMFVKERGG